MGSSMHNCLLLIISKFHETEAIKHEPGSGASEKHTKDGIKDIGCRMHNSSKTSNTRLSQKVHLLLRAYHIVL